MEKLLPRRLHAAVAQLGPIHRSDERAAVVRRLMALLREAHTRGARFVVFPELALTTFFPRWWMTDQAEIDRFFEREMPNAATRPLFDLAAELGVGFYLGYAELAAERGAVKRYNTAILVDGNGRIIGRYRKIHLPGHSDHLPEAPFQHLEKRYFDVGNDGFRVWRFCDAIVGMCICNDRRWPETWRVLGLQALKSSRSATTPRSKTSITASPNICGCFTICCRCRPAPIRMRPGYWRRPNAAARTGLR